MPAPFMNEGFPPFTIQELLALDVVKISYLCIAVTGNFMLVSMNS